MSMALITMPGVQKPHCRAWFSRNASCMGWSLSALAARPSIVSTLAPSAWTASMVHDLIDLPSTWTTQAPHWLVSQPTCVPVIPRCSRRNWTNSVRASTLPETDLPLTVMETESVIYSSPLPVGSRPRRARLPGVGRDSRKPFGCGSSELRMTHNARPAGALTSQQKHHDQYGRADANHEPVTIAAPDLIVGRGHQLVPAAVSGAVTGGGAPTLSANLPKNWSASFFAVPWIRRAPTWAILPPTWASTSYVSTVSAPSCASFTAAPPLAKPATPPWPSPEILYPLGASMSDSVTLPLKAALTGPMRSRTLAVISVSESLSSDSQPGMQACSTAGSFSAAKTLSRGAAIRYSPLISIRHSALRGFYHLLV